LEFNVSELTFNHSQVVDVLCHLNQIANDKRATFQARLKHLQRLKFPEGVNTGKGKPAQYKFSHLMQMVIAIELIQAGMTPQVAADLVDANWHGIRQTIYLATAQPNEDASFAPPNVIDFLWIATPESLRSLTVEGEDQFDKHEALEPIPIDQLPSQIESGVGVGVYGEGWRTLVLHGTRITKAVMMTVAFQFDLATYEEMRQSIKAEVDEINTRMADNLSDLKATKKAMDNRTPEEAAADQEKIKTYIFGADYKERATELREEAKTIIPQLSPYLRGQLCSIPNNGVPIGYDDIKLVLRLGIFKLHGEVMERTPLAEAIIFELISGSPVLLGLESMEYIDSINTLDAYAYKILPEIDQRFIRIMTSDETMGIDMDDVSYLVDQGWYLVATNYELQLTSLGESLRSAMLKTIEESEQ
jgi:hypothetical protein